MKMIVWAIAALLSVANSASAIEREALANYDGVVAAIVTRDDTGRVIRIEHRDGSSPNLDLYYDAAGCLDRVVHSNGRVDEFDCDDEGNSIPRFFGRTLD